MKHRRKTPRIKDREGGRFRKNDFKSLVRKVDVEEFLSNMETRKSAILPKEAVYGSHEDWEHHLRKPASLLS